MSVVAFRVRRRGYDEDKAYAMTIEEQESRTVNLFVLSVLAFVIGIATGYGAVAFRALIGLIHNLFFTGQLELVYNANEFTQPSPWGVLIIFVPVIGALGVTWLVETFAPEARGHGVPEVMDAVYHKGGAIRPVVAIIKSFASALSIGSGGSVGREGPIVQIGSAIASSVGGWIRLASWQRISLVAAGAGGGIAATFNTPLGGVLFAIELILPEVSVRTFLPVAISTGMATLIGRIYFGFQPAFALPDRVLSLVAEPALMPIVAYAVLGLVIGLAATLYIRAIYWSEDFFQQHIANHYLRHATGMFAMGVLLYLMMWQFGHYYVEGVGYATIQALFDGRLNSVWLLVLLFFAKLVATSLTLGSGASGGIFSPGLFLGATLGGAVGGMMQHVFPGVPGIDVTAFAMVGMAAMVGGATGAAMTGVVMIFEMTRDYQIVTPTIIAVAISLGIRRLLLAENIYTMKLSRRGERIPQSLHSNMFLVQKAVDVMVRDVVVMSASLPLSAYFEQGWEAGSDRHIVVSRDAHIVGVVTPHEALWAMRGGDPQDPVTLGRIARTDYALVLESDVMIDVIERMSRRQVGTVLVVGGGRRVPRVDDVLGVITRNQIADSVADSIAMRSRRGTPRAPAPARD